MYSKNIFKNQMEIFKYVNNYIKNKKNKINVANSAICYFHNYGDFISSSVLKFKFYGRNYFFKYMINILKNFASVSKTKNYVEIKKETNKKFKFLIISHVTKSDFLKDGSYRDKYFNLCSKNYEDTIFFLNSGDGFVPKLLNNNLVLYVNKDEKDLALFFWIKSFFFFVIKFNFSYEKIWHEFNFFSQFSNKINICLNRIIEENNITRIVCLYEAQPYQNNFF